MKDFSRDSCTFLALIQSLLVRIVMSVSRVEWKRRHINMSVSSATTCTHLYASPSVKVVLIIVTSASPTALAWTTIMLLLSINLSNILMKDYLLRWKAFLLGIDRKALLLLGTGILDVTLTSAELSDCKRRRFFFCCSNFIIIKHNNFRSISGIKTCY